MIKVDDIPSDLLYQIEQPRLGHWIKGHWTCPQPARRTSFRVSAARTSPDVAEQFN